MPKSCLLYYITDRTAFPGDERMRRRRLLDKIAEAATHGVDYIQLREKDLPARDLESLAREAMRIIQELSAENQKPRTALLLNSRTDVALAVTAAGVHLPANDISPEEVRAAWKRGVAPSASSWLAPAREISPQNPIISVSCHSPQEVSQAATTPATFAVFAPVFEKSAFKKTVFQKKDVPPTAPAGLDALRQACRAKIPVLALGGVTLQNAEFCLQAGAAGVAAIRLFQENDMANVVGELRR
ncbi:MAG: thiamine phosphate synthase [Candidatus Sulfotelmatobacter sp.]